MHIAWPQSRARHLELDWAWLLTVDGWSGVQEAGRRGEEGEEEVAEGAGGKDDGNECVQCGNENKAELCHEEPV